MLVLLKGQSLSHFPLISFPFLAWLLSSLSISPHLPYIYKYISETVMLKINFSRFSYFLFWHIHIFFFNYFLSHIKNTPLLLQWETYVFCVGQIVAFDNANKQDSLTTIRENLVFDGWNIKCVYDWGFSRKCTELGSRRWGFVLTFITYSLSNLMYSKKIII